MISFAGQGDRERWVIRMTWHDLLFAHWPVSADVLRPRVPERLAIDRFDGQAWVGVVPFWMSGVRLRGLPGIPGLSRFCELNVRTYVHDGDEPGVWFFSLDATALPVVIAARVGYGLNYRWARMRLAAAADDASWLGYASETRQSAARFRGWYRPTGEPFMTEPASLEHWLTARFVTYGLRRGRVWRTRIRHEPWQLHRAEISIEENTMMSAAPLGYAAETPTNPPHLLFARCMSTEASWPRPLP